jgi:hypothetical protein
LSSLGIEGTCENLKWEDNPGRLLKDVNKLNYKIVGPDLIEAKVPTKGTESIAQRYLKELP